MDKAINWTSAAFPIQLGLQSGLQSLVDVGEGRKPPEADCNGIGQGVSLLWVRLAVFSGGFF